MADEYAEQDAADDALWATLSGETRELMRDDFPSFGMTRRTEDAQLKGMTLDCEGDASKTYWSADDLRNFARAFTEIADLLDMRAGNALSSTDAA